MPSLRTSAPLCVLALIGAGADTTLVAQQWSVYALLKNDRDQIAKALAV